MCSTTTTNQSTNRKILRSYGSFILKPLVTLSLLTCPTNVRGLLTPPIVVNHNHPIIHNYRISNRYNRKELTIKSILTNRLKSKTSSTRFIVNMSGDNNNNSNAYASNGMQHIHFDQMEEIVNDYEKNGDQSEYIVIDVRTDEEVVYTGKISPSVCTLPVQVIMQYNVFSLDHDDFEELCGFPKPEPDQTIVFTCKAGIRSVYACQYASQSGYTKLMNYVGGSSEWFHYRPPK
jgi:rhodanese-related sulfurtransferase